MIPGRFRQPATIELDELLLDPVGDDGEVERTPEALELARERVRGDLWRLALAFPVAFFLVDDVWFRWVLAGAFVASGFIMLRELRRPSRYLLPKESTVIEAVLDRGASLGALPASADAGDHVLRLRDLADVLEYRTARGAPPRPLERWVRAANVTGMAGGALFAVLSLATGAGAAVAGMGIAAGFGALTWWTERRVRRREQAVALLEDALARLRGNVS